MRFISTLVLSTVVFLGGCSHFYHPTHGPTGCDNCPPTIDCPADLVQQPAPPPVDPRLEGEHPVDYFVGVALAQNPEIQAKQRIVAARAQVIPQVTSLPDPMVTDTIYPFSDNTVQTAAGRFTNSMLITQKFPWCGKLQLRGEVADLETKIALTDLAETQLKVIEAVKLSYYDLYFNQQAIEITKESEGLLKKLFIPFAEARYRTGKTSQQDVLRAQVELNKVQDQLVQLRRYLKVTQADLAKLLSTAPQTDFRVETLPDTPDLPKQFDALYKAAVASRPELQGKLHAVLRDQKKIDLAQLEYFPDVTVGLAWTSVSQSDALASQIANGNDAVGVLFSINLPIWKDKLNAGVSEAEQRTAASARLYEAARDDTFRLIRRFSVQAQTFEEEIKLFKDQLIPKAEQTLKISFEDYRVGKIDALQVIDNWLQLLRLRVQQVRLEASLGQSLASLERVVGTHAAALQPGGSHPACHPGLGFLPEGQNVPIRDIELKQPRVLPVDQ